MTENQEIAAVILQQMGGQRRLKAFTGANSFVAITRGVQFKFPNNRAGMPNGVSITLNGMDLYDVKFFRTRGLTVKTTSEHNDMYCDGLVELFERQTGLFLHF